MPFRNRIDAGRQLAAALHRYRGHHPVILALPRGGVPVAAEVAAALDAPLDLLLVRKIGLPGQPEFAIGAIAEGEPPAIVRNADVIQLSTIDESEFAAICDLELIEIERRRKRYLGSRPRTDVRGQVVIIIDDGIATGATALAAIRAVRRRGPGELVLAVPVAAFESVEILRSEVDVIVCLETPQELGAIGFFYSDFRQVGDDEVIGTLKHFPANRPVHR